MWWRIWYSKELSHTEEEQVSKCKKEAQNMAFSATKQNYKDMEIFYFALLSVAEIF